jgi:hypothetical protein
MHFSTHLFFLSNLPRFSRQVPLLKVKIRLFAQFFGKEGMLL